MEIRFCDDRGERGFSWVVEEPSTRTSHALAADGKVWLVDPVRHEPALERARSLGVPMGVIQLLDRHNRDCASIAEELGVPHLVTPEELPGTPFELHVVKESPRWRERALWWPAREDAGCRRGSRDERLLSLRPRPRRRPPAPAPAASAR